MFSYIQDARSKYILFSHERRIWLIISLQGKKATRMQVLLNVTEHEKKNYYLREKTIKE